MLTLCGDLGYALLWLVCSLGCWVFAVIRKRSCIGSGETGDLHVAPERRAGDRQIVFPDARVTSMGS